MYAAVQEGPYSLPAVPYQKISAQFRRQIVVDPTGEQPGTIVVRLQERYLYLVQTGGDAIRYGVGIGKEGFLWNGWANIQYKKEWPRWTPPREMIQRKPELAKYEHGMEPGPENPLGARALYIFKDGVDTGYRIRRLAGMVVNRPIDVVRLCPLDQPGHHRSLQSCARGRRQ